MRGGVGDDVIEGGAAGDDLRGETGNDTLRAGDGPDKLAGGDGDDTLDGGNADDTQQGDAGVDTFVAGSLLDGADTFAGGSEPDTVSYASRRSSVSADLDGQADDGQPAGVFGLFGERDRVGTDVERLIGGTAADTLTGDSRPNVLDGGASDDTLRGRDTTLSGLEAAQTLDDTLIGGPGADSLLGGLGKDKLFARDGTDDQTGAELSCGTGPGLQVMSRTSWRPISTTTTPGHCRRIASRSASVWSTSTRRPGSAPPDPLRPANRRRAARDPARLPAQEAGWLLGDTGGEARGLRGRVPLPPALLDPPRQEPEGCPARQARRRRPARRGDPRPLGRARPRRRRTAHAADVDRAVRRA